MSFHLKEPKKKKKPKGKKEVLKHDVGKGSDYLS